MTLADLSTTDLKEIQKLLKEKEKLQSQIDRINSRLSGFDGQPVRSRGAGRSPVLRRGKRGQMKARVVEALTAAGKEGMSVKDLAQKLRTTYGNVSVWFQSTGKQFKEIRRVAPGRYAWRS